MFKVDDDADETPHIIPGGTNDTGDTQTFSEHLVASRTSVMDDDADETSDEDGEDETQTTPRPLI